MPRLAQPFRADHRGSARLEYGFAAMFVAAGLLLMSQTSGTFLVDRLSGLVAHLLPFDRAALLADRVAPPASSGCGGGNCPIRLTSNPVGIPSSRNPNTVPAFVVSVRPGG